MMPPAAAIGYKRPDIFGGLAENHARHEPAVRSRSHTSDSLRLLVFRVLLTAVEFGVFTKLGSRRITGAELGAELGLHSRGISDFFDALVAMKFLDWEAPVHISACRVRGRSQKALNPNRCASKS